MSNNLQLKFRYTIEFFYLLFIYFCFSFITCLYIFSKRDESLQRKIFHGYYLPVQKRTQRQGRNEISHNRACFYFFTVTFIKFIARK